MSVPGRISSEKKGFLMVNVHNSNPALYETKTLHSKEMYSTWFGDDVIRFAPAAGWPNWWATLMQLS